MWQGKRKRGGMGGLLTCEEEGEAGDDGCGGLHVGGGVGIEFVVA